MKSRVKSIVVTVALVVAAAILFFSSFTIIPTGYTGVRTTFGQVDKTTLQNGFNWKVPFVQSIELVNNKQQDISYSGQIWSETSERTAIYYEGITVTYQINPECSAWIYANVSDYRNALVNQSIVASAVKASSKQLNDTDATNRGMIEPLVMATLQASLDEKYEAGTIIINKVTISNVDFDDSYNQAIAAKQKAMIEAQQEAIENEKAIAKAEAEATVLLTEAQAQAEAALIRAQAEAEANRILQESLSPEILNQMYIEKWNGQMPAYMGGESPSLIFDMSAYGSSSGNTETAPAQTPVYTQSEDTE
ncbi:MAG: hypothetical protein HUJ69_00270 [Lachnospiraceae bacterium]|nr:hypothetical protein [Lachnospiraceae bacterium]